MPNDAEATVKLINSRDKQGATLFTTPFGRTPVVGARPQITPIMQFNGSVPAEQMQALWITKMQTVLYRLAYWSLNGEIIELDLIKLLLDQ